MKKLLTGLLLSAIALSLHAQWTTISIPSSGKMESLKFVNGAIGFGGGSLSYFTTRDTGNTWTTTAAMGIKDVDFRDTSTGFAVGIVGLITKTTDGAKTWTQKTPPSSNSLWAVSMTSSTTAYIGVTGGKVYKTTNGGTSFTTTTAADAAVTMTDLYFTSSTTGCAVGSDGSVYRTTNSGSAWTNVYSTPVTAGLNSIYFFNTNYGWTVGSSGTIAYTTNGGLNWFSRYSGTTKSLNYVHFCDISNGIIVGDDGTVLRTSDGGITWYPEVTGISGNLSAVALINPKTAVIGGTNAAYRNNNLAPIIPTALATVKNEWIFGLYPNPALDVLNLELDPSLQTETLQITIMDAYGKEKMNTIVNPGSSVVDIQSLSSGLYFISVRDNHGSFKIKSFVKQ